MFSGDKCVSWLTRIPVDIFCHLFWGLVDLTVLQNNYSHDPKSIMQDVEKRGVNEIRADTMLVTCRDLVWGNTGRGEKWTDTEDGALSSQYVERQIWRISAGWCIVCASSGLPVSLKWRGGRRPQRAKVSAREQIAIFPHSVVFSCQGDGIFSPHAVQTLPFLHRIKPSSPRCIQYPSHMTSLRKHALVPRSKHITRDFSLQEEHREFFQYLNQPTFYTQNSQSSHPPPTHTKRSNCDNKVFIAALIWLIFCYILIFTL